MKTSDFYYDLPQELIAQTPIEPRDQSRLMVVDKNTGEVTHKIFKDLIDYLNPNDCLILNDTRVIPARIYGVKKETGAVVEFLLLKQSENNVWECLCKPGKRAKIGTEFVFGICCWVWQSSSWHVSWGCYYLFFKIGHLAFCLKDFYLVAIVA